MGWTTTNPGGSYGQTQSNALNQNTWYYKCYISIARLSENQVALKFEMSTDYGEDPSAYYTPSYFWAKAGSDQYYTAFPGVKGSKTFWWTGTLAAGATIEARTGYANSYGGTGINQQAKSFTGPAYTTTYSISYNGNGNTGGSTASQSKAYGSSISIRSNGFTRTNYSFINWNTASDGTGTTYTPGQTYSTNANLTLYAIWKRNNIPVFVNVGDNIYQVEKAYANVGGEIKECTVYANVNGEIKTII